MDTSGRRARLLRRAGMVLGIGCAGYAAVLAVAFTGVGGTSLTPSQLLPWNGGPGAEAGDGGAPPQGRLSGSSPGQAGAPGGAPSGKPSGAPSGVPAGGPGALPSAAPSSRTVSPSSSSLSPSHSS